MKFPDMTSVKSSNVKALGYDKRGLFVQFNNRSAYHYPSVPQEVYEGGLDVHRDGGSIGSWFNGAIKGRYEASKVEVDANADDS